MRAAAVTPRRRFVTRAEPARLATPRIDETGATVAARAEPYTLENSEVRRIHAGELQRDYQRYVALPESYRTSSRRYPVLFVTDASYPFPIVRNIAQRLAKHAGIEKVIVVRLR